MKSQFLVPLIRASVLLLPLCVGRASFAAPTLNAVAPVALPATSAVPVAPVRLWSPVQDKNFYLLSLIEKTPAVATATASDSVLKKFAADYTAKLVAGFNGGTPVATAIPTILWTAPDIDAAAEALRGLYRTSSAVKEMVDGPLRQSAMYDRYRGDSGEELLVKAWREAAAGMNNLVQVYGLGQPPRYPKIDSPFYDVKSAQYGEITNLIFGTLADDESAHQLFFQPSLRVGIALLDANRRDEAARFEPMEQKENDAAFKHIAQVDWNKYPYALILVPGQGPEEPQVQLSPKAKLVLAAVAQHFRQGKAPYIAVSGGYVHPSQTPYCEALEMKKSLMNDYGIPENAIFIDPHARHTTTNMRNVSRLIFRYGLPTNKTSLITTTPAQIRAIDQQKFQDRCTRELGYQPIKIGKRTSPLDLEFLPLRDSLHSDPLDPLDP